jgi:hypothetical protein
MRSNFMRSKQEIETFCKIDHEIAIIFFCKIDHEIAIIFFCKIDQEIERP